MHTRGLPKIGVLPKTTLGRWSAVCALAFILVTTVIFWLALSQTLKGVATGLDPLILSHILKGFLAVIAAAALFTGLAGMIKSQERSVSTFVSIAIGFFGLLGSLR